MKKERKTNLGNFHVRKGFAKNAVLAVVTLSSLIVGMAAAPITQMGFATEEITGKSIRNDDKPLNAADAAAFVQQLIDETENVLDDSQDLDGVEDLKGKISTAFKQRGAMTGKTKKQIVDLFMADVKAAIEDEAVQGTISEALTAAMNADGESTGTTEPTEPTEPTTPTKTTEPTKPTTPDRPNTNASLRQYIRSLQYDARKLLAVQGDGGTLIVDKEKGKKNERKPGNAKIIRCVRTERSLSKNFEDVAILQPTQGVIYPGALVYADQELVDGKPRPLTGLPRAPIDLRLDLPGLQDEGSFVIANPTDGKVQSAVNKALNFWNNSTSFKDGYINPSRSNYNSTIAYSSEQLAMSLGFNVKWASGDASAQFKYSSSSEKNVVVAVYRQVFYTVTFDAPNLPEQFFDSSVTAEEAKDAFNSENPSAPAYVSSVNYGRIIMLRMETDKSTSAMEAQAAFNYAAGVVTVGATAEANYNKIISNSSITVVTMGGNAEVASEAVSARGAADLQRIIKGKNAVYSKNNPGVPIAYTVKFLKDNTVAKMGSTTDFVTEDCKELDNLWVKINHSGAYIAHFYANWDQPDPNNPEQMIPMSRKEEGKTSGYQIKFDFPGDAENIRLKLENDTGLVWQPRREILNRILTPKELNSCFTVHGTTLGSGVDIKSSDPKINPSGGCP
ncbi:MAG: thiol-activated cytolysin family protein [Acidobacteria bacterium]|nr:thiol-activated cytolysin family protein [Acidobacteriota bacterium]